MGRAIAAFLAALLLAGEEAPPAPRDVSALLEPIRARHDVPGMAGTIVTSERLTAIGAAGVRRRGSDAAVTTEDLWHLGSCTKAMTATLVGVLAEEGTLGFEAPAAAAAGGGEFDEGWSGATIADLLTHRAGAPADLSSGGLWNRLRAFRGPPETARRILAESVLMMPPVSKPGTAFLYSNAGFAMAGAAAERAAKTPYEMLLREKLLAPLGIGSAGFGAPGDPKTPDQPRGHLAGGTPVEPGPLADNPPAIAPAGTVHMKIADWARFVAAHLQGERGKDGVVRAETIRRLHTPPEGADPAYAMGWMVTEREWGGGRVLTHAGSNTLWYAVVWMAPRKDFAVLVTVNQGGDRAAAAADAAAAALIRDHLAGGK